MVTAADSHLLTSYLTVSNCTLFVVIIYLVLKLVQGYRRYRKWEGIYDDLPGDPEKHWLWGHVHLVIYYIIIYEK